MGANASSYGHATEEKLVDLPPIEDEPALDLPAPPSGDDEPLLDLSNVDVKRMKKRACSVDPKLAANPKRRAPPINPKTCKEGSVAMGKDGEFYVIKSGKWMKVSKRIQEKKREQIKEKLSKVQERTERTKKRVAAKRAKTPKRESSKSKSSSKKSTKKSPGRPRKAGNPSKKSAETPKRKGRGRPKGSKNKSKK